MRSNPRLAQTAPMRSLCHTVAIAIALLVTAGCGRNDADPRQVFREQCERAWQSGAGERRESGVGRDEWIDQCVVELERLPFD
jgi:hypothetical protein